jgi:hypothetical protein
MAVTTWSTCACDAVTLYCAFNAEGASCCPGCSIAACTLQLSLIVAALQTHTSSVHCRALTLLHSHTRVALLPLCRCCMRAKSARESDKSHNSFLNRTHTLTLPVNCAHAHTLLACAQSNCYYCILQAPAGALLSLRHITRSVARLRADVHVIFLFFCMCSEMYLVMAGEVRVINASKSRANSVRYAHKTHALTNTHTCDHSSFVWSCRCAGGSNCMCTQIY